MPSVGIDSETAHIPAHVFINSCRVVLGIYYYSKYVQQEAPNHDNPIKPAIVVVYMNVL